MRILISSIILLIIVFAFVSCSQGSNPLTPSEMDSNNHEEITISDSTSPDLINPFRGVFGAWKIHIDPVKLSGEIIPSRNAKAIGDIFDADLSQFLTVSPCSNCLMITGIRAGDPEEGFDIIDVDFTMRHPFGNITTRPDLHGFDVRLIFIAEADEVFSDIHMLHPDGTDEEAFLNPFFIANPDGFTSHYDELIEDERYFIQTDDVPGNLNPYLRYFDDFSTDAFNPHAPAGHNVMPVGSANYTRTATFGGEALSSFEFYAVADVAYGQSAVFTNRTAPQYYLPAFNRTEAWRTEYWIENNNLSDLDPTSTADVIIQVFDWQQGAYVDAMYPDPAHPEGIPASSNSVRVELHVPDLQDEYVFSDTPESGSGTPDDPLQFRLTVTNQLGENNSRMGLLTVRDELFGQESPMGRMPIPETPAGFPYDTVDIIDYAHYNIIWINIANSSTEEYNDELYVRPSSTFTPGFSIKPRVGFFMDDFGKKFLYEWDHEYDGVSFDVDSTGFPCEWIEYASTGRHTVGLRVTTNTVPPQQYTYAIPVWVRGAGLSGMIETNGTAMDSTYYGGNHAVAFSRDNVYFVFTHEETAEKDVYLAIGDSTLDFTLVNVTADVVDNCYNPCVAVIEDGVNDAVFVGYTNWDTLEPDIYSISGDLDGTGFDAANIKVISAAGDGAENNVALFADPSTSTIYAYYSRRFPATQGDICVSTLPYGGASWNWEDKINSDTDEDQDFPSYAYNSYQDSVYIVYNDAHDFITRGHDIFIAKSTDRINFDPSVNLTPTQGFVEEALPAIASDRYSLAVAYVSANLVTITPKVHVKIMDTLLNNQMVHVITDLADSYQTAPSIATSTNGRYTVGYGLYNDSTENLYARADMLYREGGNWTCQQQQIYSDSCGTIELSAANVFPCVGCRSIAEDHGTENYIFYKTFENGSNDSFDPQRKLGDIMAATAYTETNKTEY